jgi:hypothetical protein
MSSTTSAIEQSTSEPPPGDFADPDGALTKVHPNYRTVLRLGVVLAMIPVLIAALVAEAVNAEEQFIPTGIIAGVATLFALVMVIRFPSRRYGARGYNMGADRLRVVRGIWWHSDTIVPFGRVQHIDVDQGPVERAFGIATMTLHTAGNHNASVNLPGLEQELAKELREEIRAHIKRESL